MTNEERKAAADQAATSDELDKAQKEVVVLLHKNQFLLKLMTGVLVICLAVISTAGIIGARTSVEAKQVSSQNQRFLQNFSNYMRCLIVNDDQVVIAVGEDKYLSLCEDLLFRGTGQKPESIKVVIPPEFTTTTTTTTP